MLREFYITNYRCFKEETRLSMVASAFRMHAEALTPLPGARRGKLLPMAAVYGGNASGKSTLVRAIETMQRAVVTGRLPEYVPFALDAHSSQLPTQFRMVLMSEGKVREYSFSYRQDRVLQESLSCIGTTRTNTIFARDTTTGKVDIAPGVYPRKEQEQLTFAQKLIATTPQNRLFLTEASQRELGNLRMHAHSTVQWFTESLCIIPSLSVNVRLGRFLTHHKDDYVRELAQADTGIEGLSLADIPADSPGLDKAVKFLQDAPNHTGDVIFDGTDLIFVLKDGDNIIAKRCLTQYNVGDDHSVFFRMERESDGTRRFMHLLPMLLEHAGHPQVYIVDEIDRSLHTKLSQYILQRHINIAINERTQNLPTSQLIFTTHDVQLMNRKLLRKDELWGTERRIDHSSTLLPFLIYKDIRSDSDICKSYLDGRLGAIPRLNI